MGNVENGDEVPISSYNFYNNMYQINKTSSNYYSNIYSCVLKYINENNTSAITSSSSTGIDIINIHNLKKLISNNNYNNMYSSLKFESNKNNSNTLLSIGNAIISSMNLEVLIYPVQVIINQPFKQVLQYAVIYYIAFIVK